jgi:hypothetical protein
MANANSTPKVDFFNFSNELGYKIWQNHAAASGVEALLILKGWEDSEELTAAKYLINKMQDDLKALASLVDAASYTYVSKQSCINGMEDSTH